MDICDYLRGQFGMILNDQQRAAVEEPSAAVLLLAVPGAGKTTALVARIAHLVGDRSADPARILAVTFSREAAKDLSARWEQLFGGLLPQAPRFFTIHSFCYAVLRRYAAKKGSQLPALFDEAAGSRRVLTAICRETLGEYVPEDTLDDIASAMGFAANMRFSDEQARAFFPQLDCLGEIRGAYGAYKRERQLMDFDDMLTYAHTALTRYPTLCREVAALYDHVLVDEAQDTSRIQHEILRLVAGDSVFMVGDEDQSIYRFRGAYPAGLLEFGEHYPGAKILKLEENFRSTPQITQAADRFIRQSRRRYPKAMITNRPDGPEIVHTTLESLDMQYAAISGRLAELGEGETAAVLYRGGVTGAAMADRLDRDGIPFYCREGKSLLLGNSFVRDVAAFFRLSRDPGDLDAFAQVYYKMGCRFTREVIDYLRANPAEDIWDALADKEDLVDKSTARLSYLQAVLRNLRKKTPQKALTAIFDDLGYLDYQLRRGASAYQTEVCGQQMAVLMSIASGCEDSARFLERLEEVTALTAKAARRKGCAVTLSTIHAAKGLEFDRVYLADLVEGVCPAATPLELASLGLDDALEEEARVFYVAVTRARARLELFCAEEQGGRELTPSRFLQRLEQGAEEELLPPQVLALAPGVGVLHRYFGVGEIASINHKAKDFTVSFPHGGPKTFDFSALEDRDLMKIRQGY